MRVSAADRRTLGVYFLDVGQGDATLIFPPTGEGDVVVFDCRDELVLLKVLEHWNVRRIAAVIVSHLDRDHIAGMLPFLKSYTGEIESIFLGLDRDVTDEADRAGTARSLIDYVLSGVDESRWEVKVPYHDRRPLLKGEGWSVRLLAPSYARFLAEKRSGQVNETNCYSSILRVEMAGRSVLIGGDATLSVWSELTEKELSADTFRIPHHGGPLTDGVTQEGWDVQRLYAGVQPSEAVVSVGSGNGYGQPDPEWIAPVASKLMCTQVTPRCEVDVVKDASTWREQQLSHTHHAEPPWRHLTDRRRKIRKGRAEVPCAGTIVLTLYDDGTTRLLPSSTQHRATIDNWRTPLCRSSSLDGSA